MMLMMNDHACRHQTISIYLIEDRGFCRGHKYFITTGTIYTIEVPIFWKLSELIRTGPYLDKQISG